MSASARLVGWPLCTVFLTLFFHASPVRAQFAGWRPTANGVHQDARPLADWSSASSILWQTELPNRSFSSPVVVGDRIFLTAEPTAVLCLAASDGEVLWKQDVDYVTALGAEKAAEIAAKREEIHQQRRQRKQAYETLRKENPDDPRLENLKEAVSAIDAQRKKFEKQYPDEKRGGAGNAAATPAVAGNSVYVALGTGIVAAFDLLGNRQWIRHIEAPQQGFGHSASPVVADGKLIVHYVDMVALDPKTGKELWRCELPARFGTPAVGKIAGHDVLVTPSGAIVQASNGKVLAEQQFRLSHNSPLIHNGVVYAHESGTIKALRLPSALNDIIELEVLWETSAPRDQRMASAAYHQGLLYAAGRKGILDVTDAETGKILYKKRLEMGDLFASISIAGDLIFIGGRNGKAIVLKAGRTFAQVAENELERISSTPAFVGDRIYVRSDKHLYCIGK